jgi:hypothetical protein
MVGMRVERERGKKKEIQIQLDKKNFRLCAWHDYANVQ